MSELEIRSDPPWQASELFAAFLLGLVVPAAALYGLLAVHFYEWQYGPEMVRKALAVTPDPVALARLSLWAVCLAFPFQMLAVVALLRQTSRAAPRRMGLTLDGAGPSLLAACGLAIVAVPACYAVQWSCLWIAKRLGAPEELHSFARMAQEGLGPAEWVLVLFAACVAAPAWEEFFFRGLVQRWVLGRGPAGEAVALGAAVAFAVLARLEPFQQAQTLADRMTAMAPAWCALGLCLTHPLWPREWRGLFAVAMLFAFVHSKVWPTPVPLLLFGLGLGWLAQRWPTLAGPFLLHAVFNGVACALLLGTGQNPGDGPEARSEDHRQIDHPVFQGLHRRDQLRQDAVRPGDQARCRCHADHGSDQCAGHGFLPALLVLPEPFYDLMMCPPSPPRDDPRCSSPA